MRQFNFEEILLRKAKPIMRLFDKMKVVVMSFMFVIVAQPGVAKSGP